ncbi:unnamed protein product [Mytilus coruscus]|uniref:Uncharacterized protein n=1 Tax=Mytilus coruscus TaxID=42192 RepID=A0A6J8CX17_MYTCO|nr:unnamed protein product [Mytilus coruscus]
MIYNKDGLKRGHILLIGIQHSIVIINSNHIGVSVIYDKQVCVIDTDKWQFVHEINVYDDCRGLVYFKSNLIVNCEHKGLMYIEDTGKIVKQINNMKSELYIHLSNKGNIYYVKSGTKRIHVYNLTNYKRSKYHLKGLSYPTGLTTDKDDNLLVAWHGNDTIFVRQSINSIARVILDSSDGIDRPVSIDFDHHNDELLAVNNDAHSIFLFKKK